MSSNSVVQHLPSTLEVLCSISSIFLLRKEGKREEGRGKGRGREGEEGRREGGGREGEGREEKSVSVDEV